LSVGEADLGAEQEVDLRRYWHAVVVRWWLPLVGLLAGALIGYLISLGGGQVWKASSTVYLGNSYSTAGGVLLQGPQANPAAVSTIARSEDSIERAAEPVTRALLAVQLGQVLGDQNQSRQLLIQAQQIERPQVLTRAAAVKATARSKRNSVLVGAFIGLLIGLAAALVWERAAATRATT
jgi:uncharacterized protein involved in exopolysaccharide biosynthesis